MAVSVVFPVVQFTDLRGRPLSGGRIHTYVHGTNIRAMTYQDAKRTARNTNPIILNARGEAAIYLDEGVAYKFVVQDADGATIMTQEPVYGAVWPNPDEWPDNATLAYRYMSEAKAAAESIGVIKFYDTYAQAQVALSSGEIGEGDIIEVAHDETRDSSPRARYKVEGGALVFVIEFETFYPLLPGSESRPMQAKLRDTISVKDFGAIGDGITDDQDSIVSAVDAANAIGAELFWPDGTYITTDNIPHFHDVAHSGVGVIKRGSDEFLVSGRSGFNRIYVAASGGDSANDGLSAGHPKSTIQQAIDVWAKYAKTSATSFIIDLAAGIYTDGAVADGIVSPSELTIEGKISNGNPSVIIDGSTATTLSGLNFNNGVRARVRNLKVQNFSGFGASGIVFQNGSYGVIDTCDASGNEFTGFNASQFSNMILIGRCTVSIHPGGIGIRYYRQSTGSISDGFNMVTCDGGAPASLCVGLQVRDNSYVVCNDGIMLSNCDNGLSIWKHSYCELRTATLSNNNFGMTVDASSIFANATGVITYSGNGLNQRFRWGSYDQSDSTQQTWDSENKRFGWGGVLSPQQKYHHYGKDGASGIGVSSNYDWILENQGNTGMQWLTNGRNISIDFDKKSRIVHISSDNTLRIFIEGNEAFRLASGGFYPTTDNMKNLGVPSNRWSTVYAGTGTINTSDEREKQQIKPIDDAVLRAWEKIEYCQFKFNDAVNLKGDGARWHVGLIAQRVKEAFESEGLNAFEYGLLCYDEWAEQPEKIDEDGVVTEAHIQEGNRFGIRYEEALAIECAYLRSKIK